MKRKAIENVINGKFQKWVKSIKDENVRELVKENTIITGGCIVSLLLNEKPNDFDIYFTNKETVLAVANYYVSMYNKEHKKNVEVLDLDDKVKIFIQSDGVSENYDELPVEDESDTVLGLYNVQELDDINFNEFLKYKQANYNKEKYKPVFLSSNAITLTDKIQIVVRFYGDASKIHENFDFIHCTNYWKSSNKKLYTNSDALESILAKHLYYHGSKYPLCSIIRTRKFIKRGWHINAGQYLKMAFQLNELDLKDISVLEDQLIGVDAAYFTILIEEIRKEQKNNSEFEIDSGYVASLVDKIF